VSTIDVINLGKQIQCSKVPYVICPQLWNTLCILPSALSKEIKYLNDDGTDLNPMVQSLPKDKGGVYLFYVKSGVLPCLADYLMYIGRALKTDNQNLRKRCKEYFQKYSRDAEQRPKIKHLMEQWGNYLYLRYVELEDNHLIIEYESHLINSLLPPFNDMIPDQIIRAAQKAFP
jgi:excinuclease UvrABC nuclease subunit